MVASVRLRGRPRRRACKCGAALLGLPPSSQLDGHENRLLVPAPGLTSFRPAVTTQSRPAILVDQTAEHVLRSTGVRVVARTRGIRSTGGYGQAQYPMWSLLYVVSDVGLEHSLEVPTTADQDEGEGSEQLTVLGDHPNLRPSTRTSTRVPTNSRPIYRSRQD